jgi:PAS domain S-box-containing protein
MDHFSSAEKSALIHSLCAAIPDIVFFKDPEGAYLFANHTFERLYGYTLEQIHGKTDFAFLSDDEAAYFEACDKEALAAGKATVFEAWQLNVMTDERECFQTIKAPVYAADGRLMGLLGVVRNVTEQRQAQELLRASLDKPANARIIDPS